MVKKKTKTKALKAKPAPKLGKGRRLQQIKKHAPFYVFLLPGFVLMVIFGYVPLYGLIGAFQNYSPFKGFSGSQWVGLDNIMQVIKLPDFSRIVLNTFRIGFWSFLANFISPIILALLINEVRVGLFKRISQTISYFPNFVSWVVAAGLFSILLSADGPVNQLLLALNIVEEPIYFFAEPGAFTPLAVGTSVWKGVGFSSILYLAVLTGINPELYEAAELDGANKLQQIWNVTIPGIMPTVMLMFVLNLGGILATNFDQIYNMQNSMNMSTSDTLDTYIYRIALHGTMRDYSRGIAIGLFRSLVGFILFLISNRASKRFGAGSVV